MPEAGRHSTQSHLTPPSGMVPLILLCPRTVSGSAETAYVTQAGEDSDPKHGRLVRVPFSLRRFRPPLLTANEEDPSYCATVRPYSLLLSPSITYYVFSSNHSPNLYFHIPRHNFFR